MRSKNVHGQRRATLQVGVGSLSDPKGLPGLAHFLEHMLFYSNEKYPEEDAYSKFIVRRHPPQDIEILGATSSKYFQQIT